MTTTATNTNTTTTRSAVSPGRRVRRIVVAAGVTAAFAGTAMLAVSVLRDDADHHTAAVVVPAPYNALPNLNDVGVSPAPSPAVVVVAPYNGLPNLNDLGVTVPTVAAGTDH